jgi:ABC-2 type transport system permease protein
MILMAAIGGAVPGLMGGARDGGQTEATQIAATADAAPALAGMTGFEVSQMESVAEVEQAVRTGQAEAGLVTGQAGPGSLEIIAETEVPTGLVAVLTVSPPVRLLDPPDVAPEMRYIAGVVFAVLFFMIVMLYGQTAAQNTVVEKQTRVIEILLATVPARVLLAGKVVSNALLAFATVAGMALAMILGMLIGGTWGQLAESYSSVAGVVGGGSAERSLLDLVGSSLAWFLPFFAVAFIMFSSLMVGSAATVSRLEDIGSALAPAMILIMVPYFLVISFVDNEPLVTWLSYIPFSSPTAMPLRLITGAAQWWEPAVSLGILALTTWVALWLAGKLYENSILRTGARIKLKEAWAGGA